MPRPAVVNGTLSGIELRIGSPDVDPSQAIVIPVKYSKATMKARPPTLSKAWKPAMELQVPQRVDQRVPGSSSQLVNAVMEQSQGMDHAPAPSDLAAMISAEVRNFTTYVIKRPPKGAEGPQTVPDSSQLDPTQVDSTQQQGEEEEEPVAKEDIVKAWRFGSTWVPMEKDTFDPLDTHKGVEILGFFPRNAVSRS
jgi:ATP-dependent DNA helicase 2 subunit 2